MCIRETNTVDESCLNAKILTFEFFFFFIIILCAFSKRRDITNAFLIYEEVIYGNREKAKSFKDTNTSPLT